MNAPNRLSEYQSERDHLLFTIQANLEGEPSILAAWLFGSLGRGDGDALSDIDLWIAANDSFISQLHGSPGLFTDAIASPILALSAPQNAPQGGYYRMTCYDAPIAPHIVDWYWQPQAMAHIFPNSCLLFDKTGFPASKDSPDFSTSSKTENRPEPLLHDLSFFWMMLLISGKHAYRQSARSEIPFMPLLESSLEKARRFLGRPSPAMDSKQPAPKTLAGKLDRLSEYAIQMQELMDEIQKVGEVVPDKIAGPAFRYLNMLRPA